MVGHTPDTRVVLTFELALEELDCKRGFSRALCGVMSIEVRAMTEDIPAPPMTTSLYSLTN